MMNEQCDLPSFSIFSERKFLDVFQNEITSDDLQHFAKQQCC